MQDNDNDMPIDYHDDNRVLRYLLQTVKGLRPVSGGVLGEALEEEYRIAEEESRGEQAPDFNTDIEF